GRHELARGQGAEIASPLETAPQVAVGDDAHERAAPVDDAGDAEPLRRDLYERVAQRRRGRYERQGRVAVHEVLDPEQAPAERPRRMQEREVVGGEAALLEHRDG